ncbi:hypothetical protein PPERSA_11407 [Pseudocohnilembus persalinus]|uniref:Uncharacterized protein n=1 Tax=Pseudocohnilembus persalinus TaxID=266149 RepID=A0A0V0QPS1_PSEPJ|nr:hypothetical protein PPERSA_11407 [Pseudocohnilembus persalinus]|eukprot:KRX04283.1 hypothetical protein PPERSA_11407 [Pseudocohnilembus persalinus]
MEIQEPLKQDSQEIEIEEGKRESDNTIKVAQKNIQFLQNYDFRSQRISVGFRNIQTKIQLSIEYILPLQKESKTDSSYKVFIYYRNGFYEIWDIYESEIYLIANPNNKETPHIYQIDLDQNQVAIIEINKTELQKWGQEDGLIINEVLSYNQFNNIMVFKISSNQSADIVYDPINNEIQHIKEQLEGDSSLIQSFSKDGSYYISYQQSNLQQFDESSQEPQQIDLYINSLISIKSTIIHIMEQSKLMDIYVPSKNKSQLKESQKPDFENEQFLQDVINCLTIGIKQ